MKKTAKVCDVNPALHQLLVPISTLRKHDRNPRLHDEQSILSIKSSIRKAGQQTPIVVNKDNVILKGNGTFEACVRLGWTHIAALVFDRTGEGDEKFYTIADNRTAELSTWDEDILPADLRELDGLGFDPVIDLMFTEEFLPDVQQDRHDGNDPDSCPKEVTFRTNPGDLWTMEGGHRILCGDARNADDLEVLMESERYSLLVTDPPYGVSYASKKEFLNRLDKLWRAAFSTVRKFARKGASYYITGPQGGDLLVLLLEAIRDSGFPLRHMLIWAKNNHVLGRADYHYKHEPILFGWVEGSHRFYGPPGETSLWQIDPPSQSKLHPTMKPVELFGRAMRNSSKADEVVLDTFLGSGTTLIAAERLGRRCFGLELEPKYCDVAVARWEKFTGKKAKKEETP